MGLMVSTLLTAFEVKIRKLANILLADPKPVALTPSQNRLSQELKYNCILCRKLEIRSLISYSQRGLTVKINL